MACPGTRLSYQTPEPIHVPAPESQTMKPHTDSSDPTGDAL